MIEFSLEVESLSVLSLRVHLSDMNLDAVGGYSTFPSSSNTLYEFCSPGDKVIKNGNSGYFFNSKLLKLITADFSRSRCKRTFAFF